jgi:ribosomal 30S subunit maturation factor RimM
VVVRLSPGIDVPGEGLQVELRSEKHRLPEKIERMVPAGNDAIIAFSGVRSIHDAFKLVGYSLFAELATDMKGAASGVLGFTVFDSAGNCWGRVKAQPRYSLNQLLEVEDEKSGETLYVPWHESIVKKINRRARTILIDPPTGLRELNR